MGFKHPILVEEKEVLLQHEVYYMLYNHKVADTFMKGTVA